VLFELFELFELLSCSNSYSHVVLDALARLLQVDVIEAQYAVLQERIEASKDFADLTRFHQE
jgi:hypothetical protein